MGLDGPARRVYQTHGAQCSRLAPSRLHYNRSVEHHLFFCGAVKSDRETMSNALPESMIHCPGVTGATIGASLVLGFMHDFAGCPFGPAEAGAQDFMMSSAVFVLSDRASAFARNRACFSAISMG